MGFQCRPNETPLRLFWLDTRGAAVSGCVEGVSHLGRGLLNLRRGDCTAPRGPVPCTARSSPARSDAGKFSRQSRPPQGSVLRAAAARPLGPWGATVARPAQASAKPMSDNLNQPLSAQAMRCRNASAALVSLRGPRAPISTPRASAAAKSASPSTNFNTQTKIVVSLASCIEPLERKALRNLHLPPRPATHHLQHCVFRCA